MTQPVKEYFYINRSLDQGKLRRDENVQFGVEMMRLAEVFLVFTIVLMGCFFCIGRMVNGPHHPTVTQADREYCAYRIGDNADRFCKAKGLR